MANPPTERTAGIALPPKCHDVSAVLPETLRVLGGDDLWRVAEAFRGVSGGADRSQGKTCASCRPI